MRILYVHQYFATRSGATGTRSYEFAKYLVGQGHHVTMITGDAQLPDLPASEDVRVVDIDGIEVVAIPNRYSNYMTKAARIRSFLQFMMRSIREARKRSHFDVVFATSTPLTVGITGMLAKRRNKIPFVFEVRDLWPEAPVQMGVITSKPMIQALKTAERVIYRAADHIVALSPGMVDGVLAEGVPAHKVSMIPNCSDLDLFRPDIGRDEQLVESLGLTGKFIAIHAGSMGEANGLMYVVEAAKVAKERGLDDLAFVLSGDGKTRPVLEAKCREYGLTNVVFTGSIKKQDMPKYVALADVTMTLFLPKPILGTNSPNKFFDAISAGKPVVVNTRGWVKDIVLQEQIGRAVAPERPDELVDALEELRAIPDELRAMGVRARALAEREYNRLQLAAQVEAIFEQVSTHRSS